MTPLALSLSEGHLAQQFLYFGIGVAIIIIISFILFQMLWKAFNIEALKATKLAITIGLVLAFILFTVLFNTFVSLYSIIIAGIIVVALLFFTVTKLDEN